MDLDKLAREIKAGEWEDLLSSVAASNALKMTAAEIRERLTHACGLEGGPVDFNSWFDIYWTAGWVNALLNAGIAPASTVLEIGAGLSSNFVRAASSLLGSRGRFVTINLNRRFSEDFTRRNRQLPIRLRCVEGNALHVHEHLAEEASHLSPSTTRSTISCKRSFSSRPATQPKTLTGMRPSRK